MSHEDRPTQKCTFEGCINEGVPLRGYDFFVCDACADELDRCLAREYRKCVWKLLARHANN